MKKKIFFGKLIDQIKQDKLEYTVYVILQGLVILTLVRSFFRAEYNSVFFCVLTSALLLMPAFIERTLKVNLPKTLTIIILLFVFAAEILGEINAFYLRFESWDTILHTLNGFLCAAIGIGIIDLFNTSKKTSLNLSPIYVAVAAFCFSMTIGVLWEFFEYGADLLLATDMQKDTVVYMLNSVDLNMQQENVPVLIDGINQVTIDGVDLPIKGYLDIGLHDTMFDMFVNFIGALVFSVIGYFYVKAKGKGKFAKEFIMTVKDEDSTGEKE